MNAALALVRFEEVLRIGRTLGASDLHLCAGMPPVLRIDGALEYQDAPAPTKAEMTALTSALFDERGLRALQRTGDASMTYRHAELGGVRVHAYRADGTVLALRLLAPSVPSFQSLHLPAVAATFAERSHGLVIFAGPTGSGKSTALAALIGLVNSRHAKHIITIEDPVEYLHRSDKSFISQREVGEDSPTFAQAVHGALRSDPDVMLIGEMRDAATMRAAITAAETGHLVLTTLHTADAPQTVERITGVFGGDTQQLVRLQLAQTLVAVVCMRLVPRSSGTGRLCACEVLLGTDAARSLIREGKTHQLRGLIETSRAAGMQTLEADLSEMASRGEITLGAARSASVRESELRIGVMAAY